MFFGLPDQARELQDGVRSVLSTACTPATIRGAWPGGDDVLVEALWKTLGELGLTGLLVPDADGGLGLDELVAVAAMREAGYAGVPGPLVETVLVAAPLLASAGVLTEGILDGSVRIAVQTGDLVPYAQTTEWVLQLRDGKANLLQHEPVAVVETVDGSRAAARVAGTRSALEVSSTEVEKAQLRGALGTAAFLVGLADRMVDMTVDYVKERKQFGVPIGSFQAVKHPIADAVVGNEFAWPAVLRAANSLVTEDADSAVHVSMAKALASDAAYKVSRVCLQSHGAMGYTVEYDLHLFAKRAWALAKDWGTASQHRERIGAHLKIERTAT